MDTVHLLGSGGTHIGVLSRPPGPVMSDAAVILLNSGLLHRVGPFRLYVQLARRLAAAGIPVLRIDQSGKGDSERRKGASYAEAIRRDFEDAASFLREAVGARRFVIAGLCSGADDGLFLASEYPEIAGGVLLEAYAARTPRYYLRHYAPRLLRLRLWALWSRRVARGLFVRAPAAPRAAGERAELGALREPPTAAEMRKRFRAIVGREARLLCVFTSGARGYYNYSGQLVESLKLSAGGDLITELYLPEAKHTYPLVLHREHLIEEVCRWLETHFGKASGQPQTSPPPDAREELVARAVS